MKKSFEMDRMSTKRPASDAGGSEGPPAKKSFTRIEPLNLGSIYSLVSFTLFALLHICISKLLDLSVKLDLLEFVFSL